jgi:hypothetical protein
MRPPAFRPAIPVLLLAGALLASAPARAQREAYTYLSFVGPEVSLVSPADEDAAARINMPVLPGDVLVTGSGSRVEAVLSDGNVVRLDGRSELRFERLNRTYESDDDRTILVLARGSVAVEVRELAPDRALRLDTDDATIVSPARSYFRVDAGRRGTEVYVLTGRVELNGRGGRVLVRAGEYAFVSGDTAVEVETAGVPRDRFTRFLEERYDRADRRDVKRYVGSEYSYDFDAADFESNGTWVYVPSAGTTCWRPNVPPDWTPYSLGTWRWTPAGLTWVSYEAWGWLPYHYGTWAWDPVIGWYWIPGNLYAPAWVYWSYGDDWSGWCPVGWYGGYYDSYYRSSRPTYGNERGGPWLPNLRGKVEVTSIDRRGWNFAPTARLGSRLETRDVTRGDRVPFPRGATVFVTSAPLRVDRGTGPSVSVPEAIRRTSSSDGAVRPGANPGLTSILRRDHVLDAAGQEELRRVARPSREFGGRATVADVPRSRESAGSWRQTGARAVRSDGTPVRERNVRSDEGWRASTTVLPVPVERRGGETRERAGDSGWRAPAPRVIDRSAERPVTQGSDAPARHDSAPSGREAPARSEPVHSAPAPVQSAPAYSAPAPAPVSAPAPAPAAAPAQAPAAAARER